MNAHFNPLDPIDLALLHLMQEGLPLVSRPYAALAEELECSEELLAERLIYLHESNQLRRSGLIIRHRPLGFKANAMVVWNLPKEQLQEIAEKLAVQPCVTLCYERPKRLPDWPYNLFTMIHGRNKGQVREQLSEILERLELQHIEHDLLFSETCYKQCGGRYLEKKSQKKNQKKNQNKETVKGVAVNG